MSKYRANSVITPVQTEGASSVSPIDPLRLLWTLTGLTLAIILGYSHAFPQGAYPMQAIVPSLGLVVLAAAAFLIVLRAPLPARALWPIMLPFMFLIWALWRTSAAVVPNDGIPLLGTLLQGGLIFSIALILTAVARGWTAFELYQSASAKEEAPPPPGRARILIDICFVFFLLLALGVALYAVYEYFIDYDQKLTAYYAQLRAMGVDIKNPPPEYGTIILNLQSKRVGSRFGNPNVLAGVLAMIAPLALGAALRWSDKSAKAFALTVLGVIAYVVVLTNSRGGMLTLLVALTGSVAVFGPAGWKRHGRLFGLAALICIAAAGVAIANINMASQAAPGESAPDAIPAKRYTFYQRIFGSPTVAQRLYYWQTGWEMIEKAPLVGHGLGSYAVLYPAHKQPAAGEARYPHNILIHFWVETGLIGLLLWLLWPAAVMILAIGYWRRSGNGPFGIAVRVLLVGAAAFLINNLFEMTWAFREGYLDWCLLLGVLAGLSANGRLENAPAGECAAHRAEPFRAAALALAGLPAVIGVALVNPLLVRPMRAESLFQVANDLRMWGRPALETRQEVLRLVQESVRLEPRNWTYHRWLGNYYRDLGNVELARREFETAMRLNPYSAGTRAELADLELSGNRTDRARALLAEAVRLYPFNARYHYKLAQLEQKAGNRDAALARIEQALKYVQLGGERIQYEKFREDLATTGTLTR